MTQSHLYCILSSRIVGYMVKLPRKSVFYSHLTDMLFQNASINHDFCSNKLMLLEDTNLISK